MIASIIAFFLSSDIAQAIAGVLALFAAWKGNGVLQRRKGRLAERKEYAARDERAANETTERLQNAKIYGNDPDAARRWLSERDAGKP